MADTTSRDDAGLDVDEGVPPPASAPTSRSVRRNAIIGTVTGFSVTAVAVAVGCALGGMAVTSAVGLGLFVGGWGGAAFGFMLASSISIGAHEAPAPRRAPVASAPVGASPEAADLAA